MCEDRYIYIRKFVLDVTLERYNIEVYFSREQREKWV